MMKYIFLLLCCTTSAQMEIDGNILNTKFSDINNDSFIKITEENEIGLRTGPPYTHYYPESAPERFTFLGYTVDNVNFRVENDTIERFELKFQVFDIETFFNDVVERYGQAARTSMSAEYLRLHGFKLPTEFDGQQPDPHYYDSLPVPKIEDYKRIRSITWDDVGANADESYMAIRSGKSLEIMDTEIYDVSVYIKVYKG